MKIKKNFKNNKNTEKISKKIKTQNYIKMIKKDMKFIKNKSNIL